MQGEKVTCQEEQESSTGSIHVRTNFCCSSELLRRLEPHDRILSHVLVTSSPAYLRAYSWQDPTANLDTVGEAAMKIGLERPGVAGSMLESRLGI